MEIITDLINELISVRFERVKNKIHTVTGTVISCDDDNLIIEDEDGDRHTVEIDKIDKVEILMLVDDKMRERIKLFKNEELFIEYRTERSLVKTIGRVKEVFIHNCQFQSKYETEVCTIHYDAIIQVHPAASMKDIRVESIIV